MEYSMIIDSCDADSSSAEKEGTSTSTGVVVGIVVGVVLIFCCLAAMVFWSCSKNKDTRFSFKEDGMAGFHDSVATKSVEMNSGDAPAGSVDMDGTVVKYDDGNTEAGSVETNGNTEAGQTVVKYADDGGDAPKQWETLDVDSSPVAQADSPDSASMDKVVPVLVDDDS